MPKGNFVLNIQILEQPGLETEREMVLKLLNQALATEIVSILRYKQDQFTAKGMQTDPVAQEFLKYAQDEQSHADRIADRITELGARPNFNPEGLVTRSHAAQMAGRSLQEIIKDALVAERVSIDSYRDMIWFVGEKDLITRLLLEDILSSQEEHASDLATLLALTQA